MVKGQGHSKVINVKERTLGKEDFKRKTVKGEKEIH